MRLLFVLLSATCWSSFDPIKSVAELNEFLDELDREADEETCEKSNYGKYKEFKAFARDILTKNPNALTPDILKEAKNLHMDIPGKTARCVVWKVRNSMNIRSTYRKKKASAAL